MRLIEQERLKQGLTIRDLCNLTGLKHGTIHRFEKGFNATMKSENLEKIAKALNVSPKEKLKEIVSVEILKTLPCKNQRCLLNTDCFCQSPIVTTGKDFCMNKDFVISKRARLRELTAEEKKLLFTKR